MSRYVYLFMYVGLRYAVVYIAPWVIHVCRWARREVSRVAYAPAAATIRRPTSSKSYRQTARRCHGLKTLKMRPRRSLSLHKILFHFKGLMWE